MEPTLARMDFELTEDLVMLRDAAREFAQRELLPRAARADEKEEFVAEQVRLCAEQGYLGMVIPEAHGGLALGALGCAVVMIEINRVCPSTGTTVSVHNSLVSDALVRFASEDQKQRYLPRLASGELLAAYALSEAGSGSDAGSLTCRAVRDGSDWVLDGTKLWISHGNEADLILLFARTDPDAASRGITAFLVETAWPGFSTGKKEKKMGLRGSPTVELVLRGVRVPEKNRLSEVDKGFPMALSILDTGRIGIASQSVGIAEACLEASIKYAKTREQFGQAIAEFGAIQEKIAEMATAIEASKLLTYRAAMLKDAGRPHRREASMAKLEASRCANFCAKEAVQIHGGAGYTKEFPVERYFRDARVTEIYEGTTEIQKLVIARSYLKD
jgi:alkylation response protein AidB-like acyl-CoA dehydrogenase